MLVTEEDLKSPQGEEKAIQAVKKYFETASDVLLVLDDVTTEEELTHNGIALLPKGQGQVLLTRTIITSQSKLFRDKQLVEVDCLEPAEAANLLQQTLGSEVSNKLLLELAELLFYHPLLINMTGCYMRELAAFEGKSVEIVVQEEIEKLKASAVELPKGKLDPETRKGLIHQAVERRWEINLERAQAYERQFVEESTVGKVLGICGYLAPTGIPVNWFDEVHRRSFRTMKLFGFCDQLEGSDVVDMHSLVQLFSRRKDASHETLKLAADLVEVKWGYGEDEFNIPEAVKQNSIHAHQVAQHLKKAKLDTNQTLKLLILLGGFQQASTLYSDSKNTHLEALRISRKLYGPETPHKDTVLVLDHLGVIALRQGRLSDAKELLQKAYNMGKTLPSSGQPDESLLMVSLNLGATFSALGDNDSAQSYFSRAEKMLQDLHGSETPHPYMAITLKNLGTVALDRGDFTNAKKYLEKAFVMLQKLYKKPHPVTALTLISLGRVAQAQKDPYQAQSMFQKSLGLLHNIFGLEDAHPYTANALNCLGAMQAEIGNLNEAKLNLSKAYEMELEIHGPIGKTPSIAVNLMNLGLVKAKKGEYAAAKADLNQAREMMTTLYQSDAGHQNLAQVFLNLSLICIGLKEIPQARGFALQSLQMYRNIFKTESHPRVVQAQGIVRRLPDFETLTRDLIEQYDDIEPKDSQQLQAFIESVQATSNQSELAELDELFNTMITKAQQLLVAKQ